MWNTLVAAVVSECGYSIPAMPSLVCLWARPRVERHVDGALGPRTAHLLASHLGSCPHCTTRADAIRRIRSLVSDSSATSPEPDWSGFWPGVQARIAREAPRPVHDAWWLPIWRPFWGHPRLSLGGALAAGLVVAVSLGSVYETDESGSVIVQDVSTPDPGKSVMVYSIAGQPGTVIWLLDSADDS